MWKGATFSNWNGEECVSIYHITDVTGINSFMTEAVII